MSGAACESRSTFSRDIRDICDTKTRVGACGTVSPVSPTIGGAVGCVIAVLQFAIAALGRIYFVKAVCPLLIFAF